MQKIPKNDFPNHGPDEVWEAKQRWFRCKEDLALKLELYEKYMYLRNSYKQDANMAFVKDEKGKFVKIR